MMDLITRIMIIMIPAHDELGTCGTLNLMHHTQSSCNLSTAQKLLAHLNQTTLAVIDTQGR